MGQEAPAGEAIPVPLSKPLLTHKGELKALEVRVPDFGTFIELGEIERVLKHGENDAGQPILKSEIDKERLMAWCVKLTGIDRALLSTLAPADGHRLSLIVMRLVEIFSTGPRAQPLAV